MSWPCFCRSKRQITSSVKSRTEPNSDNPLALQRWTYSFPVCVTSLSKSKSKGHFMLFVCWSLLRNARQFSTLFIQGSLNSIVWLHEKESCVLMWCFLHAGTQQWILKALSWVTQWKEWAALLQAGSAIWVICLCVERSLNRNVRDGQHP